MLKNALYLSLLLLLMAVSAPALAQEDSARVRIAHFAADAPAVDIVIDGERSAVQNTLYGDVSGWYQIPAGSYEISVVPAGGDVEDAVIGPVSVEVEAGEWYTVAAIGLLADESLDVVAIEEDYSELDFGETRVSVLHAVSGLGPVNVVADNDVLFGLLAYPGTIEVDDDTLNDGFDTLTLAEGTFDLQVVANNAPDTTLVDIGEFTFTQQRHYLIAVVGSAETPTYRLISTNLETAEDDLNDDIRTPPNADADAGFVRAAHLASGAPDVDIYIDGELSDIEELAFAEITDYVQLDVGTYEVDVVPAGGDVEDAVLTFDLDVQGARYQTAVVRGILANETLEAQVIEDDFSPIEPGLVRISMFHAFPGLGAVDLVRDDGLDAIRLLDYPGVRGDNDGYATVDLLAGLYDFTVVRAADRTDVIAEIEGLTWQAGRNYFIAVINGETNFTLTYVEIPD